MDCRKIKITLFLLCSLALGGCGYITRTLSSYTYSSPSYPPAVARDPAAFTKRVSVDLSRYQSPESPTGRPLQRPDIAVVMAASGGGYRASNLEAGVMLALEKIRVPGMRGNLLQEVDYFSSTSGGGFTVGFYLSRLYQYLLEHHFRDSTGFSFEHAMYDGQQSGMQLLREDYSDQVFYSSFRSLNLESRLAHTLLRVGRHRELTLGDIFIPASQSSSHVHLPMWVMNTTNFQNLSLFPFTPDTLTKYQITHYTHSFGFYRLDQARRDGVYGYSMPAAVGMMASATYPFAVAGTTLTSSGCNRPCYVQLFDGGIADNLGVFSAVDVLSQDRAKIKILIIVDAFQGQMQPFSQRRVPPGNFSLLAGLLTSITQSFHQHIQDYGPALIHDTLCHAGATNVLVARLNLSDYKALHKYIPAALWIDKKDQQQLIDIGKYLVRTNPVLQHDIRRLIAGDRRIGAC